jgi:predicted Zn finger-like uncharacterized protein
MRIKCPNCETSYQLADGALGSTGRKVRCASCGTVWHASPAETVEPVAAPVPRPPVRPEPSEDEWREAIAGDDEPAAGAGTAAAPEAEAPEETDALAAAEVTSAEAAGLPVPAGSARTGDEEAGERTIDVPPAGFEPEKRVGRIGSRRRAAKGRGKDAVNALSRQLSTPAATGLMIVGFVVLLLAGVVGRVQMVRTFPDLATLYAAIGLPVNLRGMDFVDIVSRREMDGSTPVLVVEGNIQNLTSDMLKLTPIRITLKSTTGRDVYAWNYVLPVASVDASGSVHFKTRLLAPPEAAVSAEVRFTDQRTP